MAIYLVDGKPRHGKTAWVISHVPLWLRDAYFKGFKIFSNVYIKVENIPFIKYYYENPQDCIGELESAKDRKNPKKLLYYWRNIHEWDLMEKGTIICDEATRYFNARQWQMLSEDTEIKLQQHGKEDLDIYALTQSHTRIDVSLKVLTERNYRITRAIGFGNRTYVAHVTEHYLEDLERYEKNPIAYEKELKKEDTEKYLPPIHKKAFWITPSIWKLYDTTQAVKKSKPMPLKHVERRCTDPKCKLHNKPKVSHI